VGCRFGGQWGVSFALTGIGATGDEAATKVLVSQGAPETT